MNKKDLSPGFGKMLSVVILVSLVFASCSKSPALANLAAKMYDHYHEHFLDVRLKQDKRLVVYYQIDIKKHSEDELRDKAIEVARYAYRNYDNPVGIQTVEIYLQTIGTPTRINESDAKDYSFDIATLSS